ncbi:unnamed protein product [Rangifer tarandus platyrhynchus]|uniref:Uncharacterized protein n=1 Tax=Rangifer tarandus platyrhynchus TaxID=3082113 RepID=A0ABN8Z3D8_RANTA|nr:unnamed protein product [Rangifer tarandus platyrhynchus]
MLARLDEHVAFGFALKGTKTRSRSRDPAHRRRQLHPGFFWGRGRGRPGATGSCAAPPSHRRFAAAACSRTIWCATRACAARTCAPAPGGRVVRRLIGAGERAPRARPPRRVHVPPLPQPSLVTHRQSPANVLQKLQT